MSSRKISPPAGMPGDVAAVWVELVSSGVRSGPGLEAFCGQVARLRDAQKRLSVEGLIIEDPHGNPIPHPAISIEKAAQDEIRKWGTKFEVRQ